jgi:hypothetical protein
MFAESDLDPEIIAMGTCRMLRIKRVGAVFFVENLHQTRTLDERANVEIVTDNWKSVAIAKGKDARQEAFEFLQEANIKVIKLSVASPPRVGE